MGKNLFLVPVWGRPEIARICLKNLLRLEQGVLCIVSNDEDYNNVADLAAPGLHIVTIDNYPLGRKNNYGLWKARDIEWDYIIPLGSDDIIKPSLFDFYAGDFNGNVAMVDRMHTIDLVSGECLLTTRARIGSGRRIPREAVVKCDWELWSDTATNRLDAWAGSALMKAGYSCEPTTTESHIVGLKSNVNIWGFGYLKLFSYVSPIEHALEGLIEETERDVLELYEDRVLKNAKFTQEQKRKPAAQPPRGHAAGLS